MTVIIMLGFDFAHRKKIMDMGPDFYLKNGSINYIESLHDAV